MGATQWDYSERLFFRVRFHLFLQELPSAWVLPGKSKLVGEMISGGGQQGGGGLGFFIWSSYMGGTCPVIVGMISIGIAGYLSSSLIRYIGSIAMPWRRLF